MAKVQKDFKKQCDMNKVMKKFKENKRQRNGKRKFITKEGGVLAEVKLASTWSISLSGKMARAY